MLPELMGGSVSVKNTLGEGSTFNFSILGRAAISEVTRKSTSLKTFNFSASLNLKILLAGDNKVNQMFISTLLDTLGHAVTIADNGLIALEMIQKDTYDLLLSDILMPVMDGIMLTAFIRKLEEAVSRIPIIGVIADAMSDHQKQYIAADMDEVSMKPINLSDLLDKIDKTIDENVHSRIA
jgi:CheY-like chemotaxis protein